MVLSKFWKNILKPHPYIGDQHIYTVGSYKYLGIEIFHNGNHPMSDNLAVRNWKSIYQLNSVVKDIDILPKIKLYLFDKLV